MRQQKTTGSFIAARMWLFYLYTKILGSDSVGSHTAFQFTARQNNEQHGHMSHTPERGWFAGTTKNMQMLMGDLEVQF